MFKDLNDKVKMKRFINRFILLVLVCSGRYAPVTAGDIGYGGSVIYNFQAEGFGADLRVKIPVYTRLYVVPEVSYFPAFDPYHEYFAGLAFHYELLKLGNYYLYPVAGAYYNHWINADDFAPGQKKQQNFSPQAGAGLVRARGCIRPFIENRYDFNWKEDNLRIGILFYPGSCGGGKEKCPPTSNF